MRLSDIDIFILNHNLRLANHPPSIRYSKHNKKRHPADKLGALYLSSNAAKRLFACTVKFTVHFV